MPQRTSQRRLRTTAIAVLPFLAGRRLTTFAGQAVPNLPAHPRRLWLARRALSFRTEPPLIPQPLDEPTVELHKKYHEATIEYTAQNIEWAQNKHYQLDGGLTPDEQLKLWHAARARFFRWPELSPKDMHLVPLGPSPQRFCSSPGLGDPLENVFVVSLARRPTRLKHALGQLQRAGVTATIVDAVDGDAVLYQEDIEIVGVRPIPGYSGHKNHNILLTTGEVGCFMSHYTIWHHMVERSIESALILEDDFDMQENFADRLGDYLAEAEGEDWNIMFVGRSPVEGDWRRVSRHIVEPGYTLWTVGYLLRLDGARALLEAGVEKRFAPLDDFFSVLMGRGFDEAYNDQALAWRPHLPTTTDGKPLLRGLAVSPPLVMPYVGSMFLSDTAMLRKRTRYVSELPAASDGSEPAPPE